MEIDSNRKASKFNNHLNQSEFDGFGNPRACTPMQVLLEAIRMQWFTGPAGKAKRKMCGDELLHRFMLVALVILATSVLSDAQALSPSLTSSIEVVRADTQADRVTIITQSMNFSDKDAAVFWPIYRKYEYERSVLDDRRVAVIKDYSAKFPDLSNGDAKSMAQQMIDCDARLADLKKKYFKKFNDVLPALTVATFFQVEHRIDLMMDVRVESSLPPLTRPGQDTQPAVQPATDEN